MDAVVSIVRCGSYDLPEIRAAVDLSFQMLDRDGFANEIRDRSVLLKPNLLAAAPPSTAVTTHPELVRAVIEVVKQFTPRVTVGDSPGFGSCAQAAAVSGLAEVCRQTGVRLGSFNDPVEIHHPDGRVCKRFVVAREVVEAEAIINLPKLKTHRLTGISCAVKNMFGCVPGLRKAQSHIRFNDDAAFSGMLVDLCEALRPVLTIVDAVVAMDGNGPRRGDPRSARLVISGTSPHAVDLAACAVVGMDPASVSTLAAAHRAGIGPATLKGIEVRGLPLEEAVVPEFRMPEKAGRPRRAFAMLRGWFTASPRILPRECRGCLVCAEVCPAGAIARNAASPPAIDHGKCIRCYCCEEMCPHGAVDVRTPALSRFFNWRF